MTVGVRCMLMRGGSSKGAYFVASDLPEDTAERNDLLLRVMGSPDARQIDGLGGAHPLTSKVAIVWPSDQPDVDVDYLFLQVTPDSSAIGDQQTCGNLLAGVGAFAIERGLVAAEDESTTVAIRLMNRTPSIVMSTTRTPGGLVTYDGDAMIGGVPSTAAPIRLAFPGTHTPILPTGSPRDRFDEVDVTCVDAGMPVVLVRADSLGLRGTESPAELEANEPLRARIESIRRRAGAAMGLGDVSGSTVPKVSIVSRSRRQFDIVTRTFIPHRVHEAIGVLGAISVVAGASTPGSVMHIDAEPGSQIGVEHPTGRMDVGVAVQGHGPEARLVSSSIVSTARKLMDGVVWPRPVG